MIDTIVLTLTKDKYHISDPDKFTPSARWVNNAMHGLHGIQSKQNPIKDELCRGIYKPRLTVAALIQPHGGIVPMLKIQLSLPKLLFGNNFDELRYKDFQTVVKELQTVLKKMGVITTVETLEQAPVSAIHYSKNIPLTDGSIPYHYIQKIKEANIKLSLDVNQTDYRNDGHSYRCHCNAYEVVFYDKIKDLEKAWQSSKRSLEKDSALQLNLFNRFKKRKKFEVLRMEVRLNKRQKMKQLFKKLGIKSDLTFKKLFKPALSKKVLLHYLDEIENKRPILLDYKKTSAKSFLATIIFNNPRLSAKQVLQLLGLKYALESATLRELRNMFAHCTKRSWYQLIADTKKVMLPHTASPFWNIREHLIKFKPLKLEKFR